VPMGGQTGVRHSRAGPIRLAHPIDFLTFSSAISGLARSL
jgi:hypothetical protein